MLTQWSETWSWSVRHAVFGACLAYYLGTGRLLSKEEASAVLGMDCVPHDRMLLATDEYLHGLISMVNELPRLAMNAVTSGDFEAPVRIAAFVKQLHAAFQVLNLKNDILRKRFDGLKVRVLADAVRCEARRRDHLRHPSAWPGFRPGGACAGRRWEYIAGHHAGAYLEKHSWGIILQRYGKETHATRPAHFHPCSPPWGRAPCSETRHVAGVAAWTTTSSHP